MMQHDDDYDYDCFSFRPLPRPSPATLYEEWRHVMREEGTYTDDFVGLRFLQDWEATELQ